MRYEIIIRNIEYLHKKVKEYREDSFSKEDREIWEDIEEMLRTMERQLKE